jgi:glycerol uptake facilitator-like aquaporin
LKERDQMKKYAMELSGTFVIALVFNLTIVPPAIGAFAAVAIGLVIMIFTAMAYPVSGGHFNPAITCGALVQKRIGVKDAAVYLLMQVVGAALAGVLVNYYRHGGVAAAAVPSAFDLEQVLIMEFLFTLLLVCVYLSAASRPALTQGLGHGAAVGAAVAVGMYSVFGNTGSVFNPALAVSRGVTGLGSWDLLWAYLVATLLAGAVAGVVQKMMGGQEGAA